MCQKIHRENQNHSGGYSGEHTAAGVTNSERRRDPDGDQTRPGKGEPVLEVRAKGRKQRGWKIGVEAQILAQFGYTEILGAHVRAAEPKRRLAPMLNLEHGIKLLLKNVTG